MTPTKVSIYECDESDGLKAAVCVCKFCVCVVMVVIGGLFRVKDWSWQAERLPACLRKRSSRSSIDDDDDGSPSPEDDGIEQ